MKVTILKPHYIFCLYFFILLLLSCSQSKLDDDTVAIVGKDKITTNDLLMSYEFFPTWAPSKKGEAALRAHLDLLIQKKLFAWEGRRQEYANDRRVIKIVNWFKNEELRKALYRNEIEEPIQISEQDLIEAYHKHSIKLHIRHLFAKTEPEIIAIQQALENGVPWEEIAEVIFRDSILANNGGDLGWLGFGEMEDSFEDSAFALQLGQISQAIRTRYGYHLIQVLNTRQNIFTSQDDFQAKKPSLEKILLRCEEKKRSSEFIKEFMENKNVEMLNKTFDFMVSKIRDHVIDPRSEDKMFRRAMVDDELKNLSNGLESYRDEVLIMFKGGQWTIGDFLEKLRNLPVTRRPRMDSPLKFRHDLGIIIRNEFLTQEAKRRGLENDPVVQKETRHWEDEYIFSFLWHDIQDTIHISEEQVKAFFEKHRSRYWLPDQVRVQEILVPTRSEAEQIIKRLKSEEDFIELAKRYSLRKTSSSINGDLGWISRRQMGNISATAFRLNIAEISNPIKVEGGFSVIKVLGKRHQRNKTYEEAKPELMADVRRQMSETIYNQWVERLKSKTKIQINDSLINKINIL